MNTINSVLYCQPVFQQRNLKLTNLTKKPIPQPIQDAINSSAAIKEFQGEPERFMTKVKKCIGLRPKEDTLEILYGDTIQETFIGSCCECPHISFRYYKNGDTDKNAYSHFSFYRVQSYETLSDKLKYIAEKIKALGNLEDMFRRARSYNIKNYGKPAPRGPLHNSEIN